MSVSLEALMRRDYRIRLHFDFHGVSVIGEIRSFWLENSRKLCTGQLEHRQERGSLRYYVVHVASKVSRRAVRSVEFRK